MVTAGLDQRQRSRVIERLGFMPPFLTVPETPRDVVDSLWRQACDSNLDSPLPEAFRERLLAYLGRDRSSPYSLVVHACALAAQGATADDIATQLEASPPTGAHVDSLLAATLWFVTRGAAPQ